MTPLIGLIGGEPVPGLLPVNPADNVLHIALTAAALLAGAVSSGDDARAAQHGARTAQYREGRLGSPRRRSPF